MAILDWEADQRCGLFAWRTGMTGRPHRHVSAFVTTAVRNELDRRRLFAFVDELAEELGPAGESEVVKYSEIFAASAATVQAGKVVTD